MPLPNLSRACSSKKQHEETQTDFQHQIMFLGNFKKYHKVHEICFDFIKAIPFYEGLCTILFCHFFLQLVIFVDITNTKCHFQNKNCNNEFKVCITFLWNFLNDMRLIA